MATPMTTKQFKQATVESLNQIFDEQYKIVELENFQKWIKEAYPQIYKEYYYVKAVGE